jgi:hypothetical protein
MLQYWYLHAVLNANPTIVYMHLPPAVFATANGPVPEGAPSLKARVSLVELPLDADPAVGFGYDENQTLVTTFAAQAA